VSLQQLMKSAFTPAPYLVYKPNKGGTGQALQLHLRLDPTWVATGTAGYFERPKGQGLFLEIAPQEGMVDGNAKFGWSSPGLVRCKLGMVDVTKWCTAYREVRVCGREVPAAFRPGPDRAAHPFTVSQFHKYGEHSTAITYAFEDTRSVVRISKSKDHARSIVLDMHEEYGFFAYLELALQAFIRVGIR
jgi:hypothetical protein